MRVRISRGKQFFVLLLCVLLGLFVLGPMGSVFAELDEPPRGTEPPGGQPPEPTLQDGGIALKDRRTAGRDDREVVMMDNLRRGVLIAVSWVFLVVGLILVALTLRKTYIWLRAVQKARVPPTRYFNLQLEVRGRERELGLYNFDYYPVVVAAAGSADLLLPDVEDSRSRFRIDYRQGEAHLLSDSSIIVNGVPRQEKPLKQDDRIIFGPYRLVFKDASIQEQSAPVPGKPVFVWQFPIVAMLLALSILFKQAGVVPEDKMLLAKAAELKSAELQSAGRHGSDTESTEQGSEQPERLTAGQVVLKRIPLHQRLLWLFSERGAEPVRPAVAEVREPPSVKPAIRESAPVMQASTVQTLPTRKLPEQKPPAPSPPARRPPAQQSTAATIAKTDSASRQKTRAVGDSPSTTEAAASFVPARTEIRPFRGAGEDSEPSSRKAAAGQPLPVRKPVLGSVTPVETAAEIPAPRYVESSPATEVSTPSQRRATQQAPALQASVLGTIAPSGVRNDGINPLEGLSFAKARTAPEIGRVKVRVIPPGRRPEYFKADILFIHAHPDDESIDFGSLMAMASRSDKRIVTLLFTDGESGLDLYPERKVGDIYPARDLTGGALSQVRVVEATRALSILGSEMYIRWGLVNRPYNTKRDEIPPDEVIRGWGGEDQLVERLIEVLEGFRPSIVVSPDRHSAAYEHFEHEAVGQLVQTALERLRRSGSSFVKGHLVSIDPYQVDRYSGVTDVDAQARDGESGLAYRSIQALALKEHVSQRDAAVIGVSRLSHLPQEFYKVLYWELDSSLQEYLK
jgi:LmbE family N-acetylglucosaminyl deacetylase